MPWYHFEPGNNFPDPSDPDQYENVGTTPPFCPFNRKMCAIQASDNGGKPIITAALMSEITRALQNEVESTNVLLDFF